MNTANENEALRDPLYLHDYVLQAVREGARFSVNLEKRTLRLNRRQIDLSEVNFLPVRDDVMLQAIEERYRAYKHSVPSERSESRRRRYFRALPERQLSDDDMLYGLPREYARCRLEIYVLFMIVSGNLRWHNEWGTWFWQSSADKDLVILRQWIEPSLPTVSY